MYKPLLIALCLAIAFPATAQELLSSEYKGNRSLAQMRQEFGILMQNGIEFYKLSYLTTGLDGQPDTASGLFLLPVREQLNEYPLLCYQHGTVGSKSDVPSNLAGGWQLAAAWAGLGYATAAPDFLGLGDSRGFHPYVHAETEASAAIDMMRAARAFSEQHGPPVNDQVFITGYSQGGHAAAALQRELQFNHAGEFDVTASAPMSGPYSISGVMTDLVFSDEPYFYPSYLPYTALSYNEAYGLFADVEAYFREPYATPIREFYQGQRDLGSLNELLIQLLTANEGASLTRGMLQDSLITVLEEGDMSHPINQALADNDVYDWAPTAPTRLYYCVADDQVPFENSVLADSVMNANGAINTEAVNVGTDLDHGQCITPAVTNAALFFAPYQQIMVSAKEQAVQPLRALYPNPARDHFYLPGLPLGAEVQLFDSQGRLRQQYDYSSPGQPFGIADLPAGLYLLKAWADGNAWSGKLVVK